MPQTSAQYTIRMFDHLLDRLPPLAPDQLIGDFRDIRTWVADQDDLSPELVEQYLLPYAKSLWPYNRTWNEWQEHIQREHGRSYFFTHLDRIAQPKFELFELHGGQVQDVYHGGVSSFFSEAERTAIRTALINMHTDVRTHALQALHGVGRSAYTRKLSLWQELFAKIEYALHALADRIHSWHDHPTLQREAQAFIRACDQGLGALGPEVHITAILNAEEHFLGRRAEKIANRHL